MLFSYSLCQYASLPPLTGIQTLIMVSIVFLYFIAVDSEQQNTYSNRWKENYLECFW